MHERILTLLHKSISDLVLDASEKKELEDWMAQSPHYRLTFEEISDEEKLSGEIKEWLRDEDRALRETLTCVFNTRIKII